MDKKIKITGILVVKNEENNIKDCLSSISWVDEIVIIENGSSDKTLEIAKKFNVKIYHQNSGTFSSRKNFAVSKSNGEWLFFIDADERVSPDLKSEIISTINNQSLTIKHFVFAIPRRNIILGKVMTHGGWWPDYVIRLFKKDSFKGFKGELHEQPDYGGNLGYLKSPLVHKKHGNLTEMLEKTNEWSQIEAKLMFEAHHPKMNLIRFGTAIFREFFLRMIKNKAYLDGIEGVIYAHYQVFSRFISYAKLWEIQQIRDIK